ncbi:hypothetical protein GCM10027280_56090 [Micromonospora polyrhachis]|uniref:Uncharacterized protein n=1 Tax=Micromonospora polyrhachis TaxID=1282883 RepID=A0A7W7ST74_9ACTN|nr:hypothetical protein [Micromonospora polyrhachis]MBB4960547.1 hypothetical protein [Micromonospora polyrhachis]
MADPERRRRRLRHTPPTGTEPTSPRPDSAFPRTGSALRPAGSETVGPRRGSSPGAAAAEERDGERGLRGLVGSGASQIGVRAALRARDAARPTPEQLAEAEARLVVVRRNWVPREELGRPGP